MILLLATVQAYTQKALVVAQDGTGDFTSIQAAINSLPDSAKTQRVILVRKGSYHEKLFIEKSFITLKGAGAENTFISIAEARDEFRCAKPDDWGVATINLKGSDIILDGLCVMNTYGRDFPEDKNISCPTDSVKRTKTVKKSSHQMALRSFATTRLIVKNCVFRAWGGDTVSPWNADQGMFYFFNCTMEGGVDFYCPRGWALAENCRFICHSPEAAIWHDGSKNRLSKTVLLNCSFSGDDGFKLGRYHRDAQFYLVNCSFAANMADADIYQKAATPPNVIQWGKRVYYYNCHRTGGDYSWHANNFPDTLGVNDINVAWVYDYRWNPAKDTSIVTIDDTRINQSGTDPVAENMLLYQRKNGGWPKAFQDHKVDYNRQLTDADKNELWAGFVPGIDATIDNEATTREVRFLVKAFAKTGNARYLAAAERGIEYLLKAQYENGGWPQFYPDLSSYRNAVTFNDNAMINVLNVLQDIVEMKNGMQVIDSAKFMQRSRDAVKRGLDCILRTQIKQGKALTAWCAQYDPKKLKPSGARKFELVSISGSESVGIVRYLMRQENPGKEIKEAIRAAINWFEKVKIEGYSFVEIKTDKESSGRDKVLVKNDSSTIWARFYDIKSNRPFFCGRDGVKRWNLSDIENERRTGYAWYGTWPAKLISQEYMEWRGKWMKGD